MFSEGYLFLEHVWKLVFYRDYQKDFGLRNRHQGHQRATLKTEIMRDSFLYNSSSIPLSSWPSSLQVYRSSSFQLPTNMEEIELSRGTDQIQRRDFIFEHSCNKMTHIKNCTQRITNQQAIPTAFKEFFLVPLTNRQWEITRYLKNISITKEN